jgi:hypothetical protein
MTRANEQWRHAFASVDEKECANEVRDRLELSERDEWAERLAFETATISRALQHHLVLYGTVTANSTLYFTWRATTGFIGSRFDKRELAIDWMCDWLEHEPAER